MCLKNKIISCFLVLMLAVAIMPAATKAADPSLADLQAQIQVLQQQITQLIQKIAAMSSTTPSTTPTTTPSTTTPSSSTGSLYVPANSTGVTYSSSTYQNPSDCPAPGTASSCSSPYAAWAKNSNNGECCQYASTCLAPQTGGWEIYSTQETCQAAKTSCLINGDSCCQNGKCYPLTNSCTSGATPYIYQCANNGSSCTPVIRCSAGKTVIAANCDQECKNRGFANGKCVGLSSFFENNGMTNPYDLNQNIIGKTTDCMNCTNGICGYVAGSADYCGCYLPDESNVPWSQPGYLGMNSACEALCETKGITFGDCHVLANDTNMVCSGLNENYYAGTTAVCKPGPNWTAGCCCHASSFFPGASTPGPNSPAPGSAGTKANGQQCASNAECSSGYCSYTFCVPDSSYCGGVKDPMYFDDRTTASNQWLDGICRFGTWKVVNGGIGCSGFACDSSSATCVNNKCVASGTSTKKANGEQCATSSDCSSGVCSYTYCVPNSTYCGGVVNPMYFANGATASNQWLTGVCRFGTWKVVNGGIGCSGFACDSATCVNNKCQ